MSKKRRTKKHNPDKRAQRMFSNVRLYSWESTAVTEGQRISHGEVKLGMAWKQLSQKEVNFLIQKNNNWVICCRALCKLEKDVWIETSMRSARDIKINDLSRVYDEMRDEVFQQTKKAHTYDVGWIIQSYHKNDRIDDNFELAYLGETSEKRREAWLKSDEGYQDRREESHRLAAA
jgi:hypothetical protein